MSGDERGAAYARFHRAVNMTASQLRRWLATDQSRSVGQRKDGGESIGHATGRRILDLLRVKRENVSDEDGRQMRRVAAFVARKTAQRPSGDVRRSRWRYSLMNWGHDPLRR